MATRTRRGPAVMAAVVVTIVAGLVGGAWFLLRSGEPALAPSDRRGRAAADAKSPGEPLPAAVATKRESEAYGDLESSADDTIRVQVVDAHDRPRPGLIATFGPRGEELSDSSLRAPAEEASAIATIRGIRAAVRARGGIGAAEWGVSVLVPAQAPPFVSIDVAKLPAEPVVVRLPPCGALALSFVGRDGAPILRPVRVRVLAIPNRDGARVGDDGDLFELSYVLKDGRLELPFVECGLCFSVIYEFDRIRVVLPRFEGPTVERDKVSRDITCEFGSISFTGWILDERNRPVAHRRLTLKVLSMRGLNDGAFETSYVGEDESDELGEFLITLPIAGVVANPAGVATAYDCELDVRSPTGPDRTLKAVATIRAGTPEASLGLLRLDEH